jgi:hypothetical protein
LRIARNVVFAPYEISRRLKAQKHRTKIIIATVRLLRRAKQSLRVQLVSRNLRSTRKSTVSPDLLRTKAAKS